MAQIVVTLIAIQQRSERKHIFPTPTTKTIGIGANYLLSSTETGSMILDTITGTEYEIQESEAVVAALIAAPTDVTINNMTNDGYSLDTYTQDQSTPTIIAHFTNTVAQTTTASPTAINDTTIEVTSATGLIVGQHFTLFNPTEGRFYFSQILEIVSTTITVDTPLDFAYPSGTFVDAGSDNLAVNGASTTQIFGIRGSGTPSGVDVEFDCTRILIQCKAPTAVDLSKFGDLDALTKGVVLRRRDGTYRNIFNVKDNGEIANVCFDFNTTAATNPQQGQDGFTSRITFAGQNKMGVTLRIGAGEDLEFLVQDDLSGLTTLHILAEGHTVI